MADDGTRSGREGDGIGDGSGAVADATDEWMDGAGGDAAYRRLDVDGWGDGPDPDRVKRVLDAALGTAPYEFDLREVAPGERLPEPGDRPTGARELVFVLAGALSVEVDEETRRVGPNEAVLVPPDASPRPVAAGDDPCRFLALGAP
ncbi:cupin domain-containing protein [Halobaculum lipolyticum]|uniref:Cupin domain-containing protein n=1 Tax=Halobaculum lipolyticum TaxID=3032001 RepID=A0ABD5WBS2_9EURY|nr:cupin domain-containing protein [Halobaculum sp. DT31]